MLLKKSQRNKKMLGETNYFIQFYNIYSKNEKENLFSSDHPGVPFFFQTFPVAFCKRVYRCPFLTRLRTTLVIERESRIWQLPLFKHQINVFENFANFIYSP